MKQNILEIWKTYVSIWDSETNRFWVRSNIFLLVNGALLTVVTGLSKIPLISLVICFFGATLAFLWLQTNKIGKHYVDRWKTLIWDCEKGLDKDISFTERLDTLKSASKYHNLRSSTHYMSIVIKILVIIWLFLGVVFAIQLKEEGIKISSKQPKNEFTITVDGKSVKVNSN